MFQDGKLKIGEVYGARVKDAKAWVARKLYGDEITEDHLAMAMDLLRAMRAAGLITWDRDNVLYIMDWIEDQRALGARRQEDPSERETAPAAEHGPEERGDRANRCPPGGAAAPYAASAPPAPSASTSMPTPTGQSPPNSDTPKTWGFDAEMRQEQHKKRREEEEKKESGLRHSNSISTGPTGAGAPWTAEGAGGALARSSEPAERADLYSMPAHRLIQAACELAEERGQWSKNGFSKKLSSVGREAFCAGLSEFRQARQAGIRPFEGSTWGRMLHGIINKNAGVIPQA
jgi:hypothetical protein